MGGLKCSQALKDAVDRGVERRMEIAADLNRKKGKKGVGRKANGREEDAESWLAESGERLRRFVDALET